MEGIFKMQDKREIHFKLFLRFFPIKIILLIATFKAPFLLKSIKFYFSSFFQSKIFQAEIGVPLSIITMPVIVFK